MKIGFIGLGNVGGKLAGSLIRNNFDVTVREIDESLTNEFKKLGAKIAKSPKELAQKSDLIIIHTEWNDFKSINFKTYIKGKKPIIFDMRNIYSPSKMKKAKIKYFGIGR